MSLKVSLVSALTAQAVEETGEIEPAVGVLTLVSLIRESFVTRFLNLNEIWARAGRRREKFFEWAVESIASTAADVVGFSSISGSYPLTLRLAQSVSERMAGTVILIGGPQASVVDIPTLEAFPFVDAIIRGEAEETFPAWLDGVSSGKYREQLPGLTFRKNGRIQRNLNAQVILDLDKVPLPAFDLHPGIEKLDAFPIEIGRGCPFACKFCSTNDFFRRKFRLKSAAASLREMHELNRIYGVRSFDLIHDMFTVDRKKIVEFCNCMISADVPYEWSCSARTDSLDEDLLRLMKRSGCNGIFFGIETGSPRLQSLIHKNLDLDEARKILACADSIGISTTSSLITGYPMETKEDFSQTVDFLSDVVHYPLLEPQLHILAPLAETPLATEYRDQLYLDEKWFEISEDGTLQDTADRAMITRHPDIFPNFYAFPCSLDRGYLRRAGDFLTYGGLRCNALMQALRLISGDMTGLFDRWEEKHKGAPYGYFADWKFVHDLIRFSEEEYGHLKDPGLIISSRFYGMIATSMAANRPVPSAQDETLLTLPAKVHAVSIQGDAVEAFDLLNRNIPPGRDLLDRQVCLAVRQEGRQYCRMTELAPIVSDMFLLAAKGVTLAEAVAEFERRGLGFAGLDPADVAHAVVEHLLERRLIRRVAPVPLQAAPAYRGASA